MRQRHWREPGPRRLASHERRDSRDRLPGPTGGPQRRSSRDRQSGPTGGPRLVQPDTIHPRHPRDYWEQTARDVNRNTGSSDANNVRQNDTGIDASYPPMNPHQEARIVNRNILSSDSDVREKNVNIDAGDQRAGSYRRQGRTDLDRVRDTRSRGTDNARENDRVSVSHDSQAHQSDTATGVNRHIQSSDIYTVRENDRDKDAGTRHRDLYRRWDRDDRDGEGNHTAGSHRGLERSHRADERLGQSRQ